MQPPPTGEFSECPAEGDVRAFAAGRLTADAGAVVASHLASGCPRCVALRDRLASLDAPVTTGAAHGTLVASPEASDRAREMSSGQAVIPGYEILGELGRGGMGVVYKALQVRLNRVVALKTVLGGDRADPSQFIRFLAEADAVAAIRHPNVVQVYESGEHSGRAYLAMEFCPNGTLAARLLDGGLAPLTAVALVEKIARGVAAAHALGIVHRDLKPGNVLFDAENEPKVADFGLAKRGTRSDLTRTGAVMGTPAYMAPEQARGDTKFVGPEVDVWALGVILYECLTGTRPFDGTDPWAVLQRVIHQEPTGLRARVRSLPRDLETICRKCLEKVAAGRYANAQALADDLQAFREGRPIAARPAGTAERLVKWARRKPAAAAACGLLLLAVVLGVFAASALTLWQRAETQRGTADSEREKAEGERQRAETERHRAEAAKTQAETLSLSLTS